VFDVPCRRSVLPAPDRRIVGLLLLGVAVLLLAAGAGLGAPSSADARARLMACNDNIDNDGDGKPDNLDPGCANNRDNNEADPVPPALPAQCSNGKDDDADGKIDFTGKDNPAPTPRNAPDPACDFAGGRESPDPPSIPECEDLADNETPGDNKIDWPADPDCAWPADTNENTRVCSNGIDDDGDGKTDWPADFGCGNPNDASETDLLQCNDGRDNDGDGTLDFDTVAGQTRDSDCTSLTDNLEGPHPPPPAACADGIDNDGDGKIDFPADPGCTSAADTDEADPQLGLPIVARPCSDGRDNDGDGKVDFPADPGCTSAADDDETDPISLSPSSSRLLSPFPVVRLRGQVYANGVRITLFSIRAPAASQVAAYCKGSSCPRKRVKILAGRRVVRVRQFERRLRGGTVLTIYVTKPGFIGKYTRFRIMNGRAPLRVDRCARTPGSRARACPTS
jgi:hypothetical protein